MNPGSTILATALRSPGMANVANVQRIRPAD